MNMWVSSPLTMLLFHSPLQGLPSFRSHQGHITDIDQVNLQKGHIRPKRSSLLQRTSNISRYDLRIGAHQIRSAAICLHFLEQRTERLNDMGKV